MRRLELLSIFALIAIGAAASGCKGAHCTQVANDKTKSTPSSTVECPSGTVCYQGECLPACNAGAEHSDDQRCMDDSECDDPARPSCVNGFCSACGTGEMCVPELNICASIQDQQTDAGAEYDGSTDITPPLDGGAIDGSVLSRDTGVEVTPVERAVTHAGWIDIVDRVQIFGQSVPIKSSTITIEVFNVSALGDTTSATVAGPDGLDPMAICDVRLPARHRLGAPEDIGKVTIQPHAAFPGLNGRYDYLFDTMGRDYSLDAGMFPPAGQDLLVYSSTVGQGGRRYITLSSPGVQRFTKAWPPGGSYYLTPHRLLLPRMTEIQLRNGVELVPPATQPLVIPFERINGAQTPGVEMVLRVLGRTHELQCTADELPGRIDVSPLILNEFVAREGPGEYPLLFERRLNTRVAIATETESYRVALQLLIRHSYVSKLRVH